MTLVFGGLLGVGRTFHLEAQDDAFQGVLMSPAPKDAVFLAKTTANFALLYAVSLLVLGVFSLFFGLNLGQNLGWLVFVLGLGSLGFVALGTLFAAVVDRDEHGRDTVAGARVSTFGSYGDLRRGHDHSSH